MRKIAFRHINSMVEVILNEEDRIFVSGKVHETERDAFLQWAEQQALEMQERFKKWERDDWEIRGDIIVYPRKTCWVRLLTMCHRSQLNSGRRDFDLFLFSLFGDSIDVLLNRLRDVEDNTLNRIVEFFQYMDAVREYVDRWIYGNKKVHVRDGSEETTVEIFYSPPNLHSDSVFYFYNYEELPLQVLKSVVQVLRDAADFLQKQGCDVYPILNGMLYATPYSVSKIVVGLEKGSTRWEREINISDGKWVNAEKLQNALAPALEEVARWVHQQAKEEEENKR